MAQGVQDTILVHGGGHVIRGPPRLVARVSHGDTDPHVAKHRHVVAPIAEGHRLGQGDAELGEHFVDPYRLTAPPRHYIRE